VYRATGSPTDDGYLASAQYQAEINNHTDVQSYRDLYYLEREHPLQLRRTAHHPSGCPVRLLIPERTFMAMKHHTPPFPRRCRLRPVLALWAREVPGLPNSPGLNNGNGPAGSTTKSERCGPQLALPASAHEEQLDLNNVRRPH
jgi:hypothetical protein